MAEAKDVEALKRRGRRRLVGAIALVLAAVIILPMVFDSAPKQALPPVSVRIPSEEDAGFKPKVTPAAPEKAERKADVPPGEKPAAQAAAGPIEKPAAVEPTPAKPEEKPAPKPEVKPQPAPEQKPVAKAPEPKAPPKPVAAPPPASKPQAPTATQKPASTSSVAEAQYYVQVGAFADPSGVYEKLKAAKIPFYTEAVATKSGKVMRVRAGPFASREAAQSALQQLRTLGFKPADVAAKS